MPKCVDARVVLIAPRELQGVVSNLLDVAKAQVASGDKLDGAAMTLAMRARTITAQNFMGQHTLVTIRPLDFHDLGSVWCLYACGLELGITRHVRPPWMGVVRR